MKMKEKFKYLAVIFGIIFIGCIPTDNEVIEEGADDVTSQNSDNFLVTNPDIPLFLQARGSNGEQVRFYGIKDTNGTILRCDFFTYQDSEFQEPIIYKLDEQSRLERIYSPFGESLEFFWFQDGSIRIKVITSDGAIVANVPFENAVTNKTSSKINPRSGTIRLNLKQTASTRVSQKNKIENDLRINITQCDEPFVNGFVGLKAISDKGNELGFLQGSPSQDGQFVFSIPEENPNIDKNAVCNSIEEALGYVCTAIDLLESSAGSTEFICSQIALAIDLAAFGPTGESALLFPLCEAIVKGSNFACKTIGASPGNFGDESPTLLSSLCDLADRQLDPQTYEFESRVYVDGQGVNIQNKVGPYPATGPFPDISVEVPGRAKFTNLFTNPFDPAPGQDYIAIANVNCASEGSLATITVTGTDGFSDFEQITLPKGKSNLSISIPGADAAVVDFITVVGEGIGTLNASIIF